MDKFKKTVKEGLGRLERIAEMRARKKAELEASATTSTTTTTIDTENGKSKDKAIFIQGFQK